MSKYFAKPTAEEFTDAEGYVDGYEFDMALDQWFSQFPDLTECWCGLPKPVKIELDTDTQLLYDLLAA